LALGLWTACPPSDVGSGAAAPAQAGAEAIDWQPTSRERVDGALARGRAVFGSITSAWCASCQANKRPGRQRAALQPAMAERGRAVSVGWTAASCASGQAKNRLVLERDGIVSAMAQRGVLRLRGDWTQRDPAITAELARFGRNGVPLYLLYRPGEPQPQVLPELLTMGIVMDALAPLVPAPVARPGDR